MTLKRWRPLALTLMEASPVLSSVSSLTENISAVVPIVAMMWPPSSSEYLQNQLYLLESFFQTFHFWIYLQTIYKRLIFRSIIKAIKVIVTIFFCAKKLVKSNMYLFFVQLHHLYFSLICNINADLGAKAKFSCKTCLPERLLTVKVS